jgi:hypothetical protein
MLPLSDSKMKFCGGEKAGVVPSEATCLLTAFA